MLVTIYRHHGTGPWSYTTEIDSKQVTTDANGNFSVAMKSAADTYVHIFKGQTDAHTAFESSFAPDDEIVLPVYNFIKFKIFVANADPYDAEDFIYIDFYSGNYQSFRYGIENFGAQNTRYPAENGIGPYEEASWYGTDVNSIVYYNVRENADSFKFTTTNEKTERKRLPFHPKSLSNRRR